MTSRETAVTQSMVAYEQLRGEIAAGLLSPNERLIEEDIAARIETSRGHVRAALVRLEQDGLVVREPNRGARVRAISLEEAIEILEVRAALESLVARRAAQRVTPADAKELKEIVGEMERTYKARDLATYSTLNPRLHRTILRIAGHTTAANVLSTLQSQAVRFQYRTSLQQGRPQESQAEHRAIVKAICAHDEDGAEAAMRTHLAHVVGALRNVASMAPVNMPAITPLRRPATR